MKADALPKGDPVRDGCARILGVETSHPPTAYTQQEVVGLFGVSDRRIASVFLNSAIDRRYLSLPARGADGSVPVETQGQLIRKHAEKGVEMGAQALQACLASIGASVKDVRHLCCVTTTGLLTPGFSSLLLHRLDMRRDCQRLDVVGMGCNAGLNGLNAACSWASANPGQLAVMVCIEVCSAGYVFEDTIETAVVNSLFGDGAAAVALMADPGGSAAEGAAPHGLPMVQKFASRVIPEALYAMRFHWDDGHGKFKFSLDREVPYVVGSHAPELMDTLLSGTGLRRRDISHWIIHSGGKKVIDSMRVNLNLTSHDVRHTTHVLRNYGNLSSGSFLFSLKGLREEGAARTGDWGVMITMGPGSSLEAALIQW